MKKFVFAHKFKAIGKMFSVYIIKEQNTLFGKAFSLSTARNFKSLHFDLIENILFEEFIERHSTHTCSYTFHFVLSICCLFN